MKYSISGHSNIHEVDKAHSQIENKIKTLKFFSPIFSLMRALLSVNNKNHL